ncbi:MAG: phage tail sheath subtilisin-like domain-containing protein [Syntrophomonas sp.]|nr:phage tail sheath subtilisin-like domain-containing protein [Syntrophomonas sp.]
MPEYLSPGVYVEEFESGGKPMEGASTSTAGFLGLAEKGPAEGLPELVTNFGDFLRIFGGYLSENAFADYRYLAYGVEHFFINGGSRCYVMRVIPPDARVATNFNKETQNSQPLKIIARNPGMWGDKLRLLFTPSSKAKTPILEVIGDAVYRVKNSAGFNPGDIVVFDDGESKSYTQVVKSQDNVIELAEALEGDVVDKQLLPNKLLSTCEFSLQVFYGSDSETYEKLSFNSAAANFVEKKLARSSLIKVEFNPAAGEGAPFDIIAGEKAAEEEFWMSLFDGSDGSLGALSAADFLGEDRGPGKRTGIQAFIDNDEVSIMAIPGVTDPNVQLGLVAHCENLTSRFAVLDIPRELKKVAEVQTHRNIFDSHYAALYHPWLQVFDPLDKRNIFIPPSGSMVGIYARSDNTRGVYKAPANEVVRACVGLDCQYNKGEQDILNPKGVNLIRSFTGQGIRVWGARTCSSNAIWKYINVRRLFIFLEQSIKNGSNWVVFEPNDDKLWARVQRTIYSFLLGVWRGGALMGGTPDEAFFVKVDRSTMTQDDIDNGRLICIIGVAPVKPAEFVIFRITQKTADSE